MIATQASRTSMQAVSRTIARQLCECAEWKDAECYWPRWRKGLRVGARPGAPAHSGESLYKGGAGTALFLSELTLDWDDDSLRRTSIGGIKHALRRTDSMHWDSAGMYFGRPGIALAGVRIGHRLQRADIVAMSVRTLEPLVSAPARDYPIDLVSGLAGAVVALLQLHDVVGDDRFLNLARQFGETILLKANRGIHGLSWPGAAVAAYDLTGMSHGASGVALALLELWHVTRDDRFAAAAQSAFAYERAYFNETAGNWQDLRHTALIPFLTESPGSPEAKNRLRSAPAYVPSHEVRWCHGAPGMALARMRAYELLGDEIFRVEAQAALRTAASYVRDVIETDISLCCGAFGVCEILMTGGRVLNDCISASVGLDVASDWAATKANVPDQQQFCASIREDPGLMSGYAGVGFFMLRQLQKNVPSVLFPVQSLGEPLAGRAAAPDMSARVSLQNQFAEQHFAQILRVLNTFHAPGDIPGLTFREVFAEEVWVGMNPKELRQAIIDAIDRESDTARKELLKDAFEPERVRFELAEVAPFTCDQLVERLLRAPFSDVDWNACTISFAAGCALTKTRMDWEGWTSDRSRSPQRGERNYMITCEGGHATMRTVDGALALLLGSFSDAPIRWPDIAARHAQNEEMFVELAYAYSQGWLKISS